jgi:uncharacterized membrane protein YsdA (DUF1294 family)/cold shock CspA family protein
MTAKGKITFWDDDKGYGFIEPDKGGERVFVHISAFEEGSRRPGKRQRVIFEAGVDSQGKLRAERATLTGIALPGPGTLRRYMKRPGGRAVLLALLFFAVLAVLTTLQWLPMWVSVAYLVVSVVTVLVYMMDKSASQKNGQRTPENTLHLLSLMGGWPGAMVAQQTLRHKSQKRRFRGIFWLTVLINLAVLAGWVWWQVG